MSKIIAFIETGNENQDLYKIARSMGNDILYITSKEKYSEANFNLKVEKIGLDEIRSALNTFTNSKSIVLYYTLKEYFIPIMTQLNIDLGVSSESDLAITNVISNKKTLRQALKSTAYNIPFNVIKENPVWDYSVRFPVVIKPSCGFNSIGVQKINSLDELKNYPYNDVLNRLRSQVSEDSFDNDFVIEKYISGKEYSAEVFVHQGKAYVMGICSKTEMKAPYFEEISYTLPANMDKSYYDFAKNSIMEICKILKINDGFLHLEFMISEGQFIVLDIGRRIGGDIVSS